MVVYGNKLYSEIKEDSSYLFSKLNKGPDVLKTTFLSNVSETRNVKVPTEIEETARTLLCPKSPLCSIAEVKMSAEPSTVSIRGTVAEERKTREPWKRTISDVKSSNQILDSDVIVGKVLQKSGLRTFETTDKEKPYFYVAVADETDSIKMMVYGNKLYSEIKEDSSYLFSKLNKGPDVLKTTFLTNVSETRNVKVPTEIEETARTLLCPKSPLCSIAEVKMSAESSTVSIRGTVAEIRPLEKITVMKQRKTKKQVFHLRDDIDSIQICVWGENTQQCKGLLVGEFIMVTNVKTHHFRGVVSLETTGFTRILKVRSASIQNGRIEIKGISKANKTQTYLEAEFNQRLQTFVVASRLLAKAFSLQLDENFKQRLVDKVPQQWHRYKEIRYIQ